MKARSGSKKTKDIDDRMNADNMTNLARRDWLRMNRQHLPNSQLCTRISPRLSLGWIGFVDVLHCVGI